MRLTLLGAGAVLATALALSACNSNNSGNSGGTSANLPASATVVQTVHNGHKLLIRPAHGVKILSGINCDYSKYNFCFYVQPGNSGPYVSTSDGSSPLYNSAVILKNKNGKADKKFTTYFYPDPGDPTSQYITYKGKVKKTQPVKFTDVYCIGFSPSECANGSGSILHLGIALEP